ncbi:MAG: hypothetical protein HYV63_14095 [Candidatus Schekmanbacteria bacterium]|nr:hypothetical protein [Candidatus Schekmanbacteria bacterium]
MGRPPSALRPADLEAEEGEEEPDVPPLLLPGELGHRNAEAKVEVRRGLEVVVSRDFEDDGKEASRRHSVR